MGQRSREGNQSHVLAFAAGGRVEGGQGTWRLRMAEVESRLRRNGLPGAKACCVSCNQRTLSPNCLTELLLGYRRESNPRPCTKQTSTGPLGYDLDFSFTF